ncbi:MAG: NosD domain-containing protein [Nanoarchaeota archaeon]
MGERLYCWIAVLFFLVLLPGISAANCGGAVQCNCGDTLTSSIILNHDITDCGNHGIIIGVNGVTLDCGGHTIDGTTATSRFGIWVSGYSSITVKYCTIQEYENAIRMNGGQGNVFRNNYLHHIRQSAILVESGVGTQVRDNRAENNGAGVYVAYGSNNLVERNVVRSDANGIFLDTASSVTVRLNNASGNIRGIYILNSNPITVYQNKFSQNTDYGAYLQGSSNVVFYDNVFTNSVNRNAYETTLNGWNFSGHGNFWSDFEQNPGYPSTYEIAGPSNGTDFFPEGAVGYSVDLSFLGDPVIEDPLVEGHTTLINMTVQNTGDSAVSNVMMHFYIDGALEGTKSDVTIPPHSSVPVMFDWWATAGDHTFEAEIDPEDVIEEIDEGNNLLVTSFSVIESNIKLLVIPYNWEGGYDTYRDAAFNAVNHFLSRIPLSVCPDRLSLVLTEEREYGSDWSGFSCYDQDMISPNCDNRGFPWQSPNAKLASCAHEYSTKTGYTHYDYLIGITDTDLVVWNGTGDPVEPNCQDVGGWSDPILTVVLSETNRLGYVTHELGHQFGLRDQYCDCGGTSMFYMCGHSWVIPNPLQAALGCDPSYDINQEDPQCVAQWGERDCCEDHLPECCLFQVGNYYPYHPDCSWAFGNIDFLGEDSDQDGRLDQGDRTVMSNEPFVLGQFDSTERTYLSGLAEMSCDPTLLRDQSNLQHLEILVTINSSGDVVNWSVMPYLGQPAVYHPLLGNYAVLIKDSAENILFQQSFDVDFFILSDPPLIVDHQTLSYRVPFSADLAFFEISAGDQLVLREAIPQLCGGDEVCDGLENALFCPNDCPHSGPDNLCQYDRNGLCDPDCGPGVDPDCGCLVPHDGMVLRYNTTLCTGTYDLPNGLFVDADNISVDGNGSTLRGNRNGTGIYVNNRQGVTLGNMTVANYSYAIRLFNSSRNVVKNATMRSSLIGLSVNGTGNRFFGNRFLNNILSALEDTNGNAWNLSGIGNSWSDLSANPGYPAYYDVEGLGNGKDYWPLYAISCNHTLNSSLNLTYDLGECVNGFTVSVSNIFLDCKGHLISGIGNNSGISIQNLKNVTIRNCTVENFKNGVYIVGSNRTVVTNSRILRNGWYGLYLNRANYSSIRSNHILNVSVYYGIQLYDSVNTTIRDNVISGNNHTGIVVVYHSRNTTILNNTLSRNLRNAITIDRYSNYSRIVDNLVEQSIMYHGISVANASGLLILNNTVRNNNHSGIATSRFLTNSTIEGNVVFGNPINGVIISNSTLLRVANNSIFGNGVGINLTRGVNLTTVLNNTVTNNSRGMVFSTNASRNTVRMNFVLDNVEYGALLEEGTRNAFAENIFLRNGIPAFVQALAFNNTWNLSGIGNTWDDFSNPGYPATFVVQGFGGGIDWFPAWINYPPVLEEIGIRNAWTGAELVIDADAIDMNHQELAFSLVTDLQNYSFDTLTGVFRWTPQLADIGLHEANFSVTDGMEIDFEMIVINVTEGNNPPTLSEIGPYQVDEGQPLAIQLSASDPDNDTLSFATDAGEVLPSPFSFSTETGLFEWTPTFDDAGVYAVNFSVSDGELDDSEIVEITVLDVNRAPVLEHVGNKVVEEWSWLYISLNATDPDGDTITYSTNAAGQLPSPFSFNETNGRFHWRPQGNDSGTYMVAFNATDGQLWAGEEISIHVSDYQPTGSPIFRKIISEADLAPDPYEPGGD